VGKRQEHALQIEDMQRIARAGLERNRCTDAVGVARVTAIAGFGMPTVAADGALSTHTSKCMLYRRRVRGAVVVHGAAQQVVKVPKVGLVGAAGASEAAVRGLEPV
jgi:hypothetical protein